MPSTIGMWVVFGLIEISDVLDGWFARRSGQVTDLGKILDPFADVISRITYFVCLAGVGIVPAWILLVIIYRELAVSYIRHDLFSRNYALAAKLLGKVKAIAYSTSCGLGFLLVTCERFIAPERVTLTLRHVSQVGFIVAVTLSISSLVQYVKVYSDKRRTGTEQER